MTGITLEQAESQLATWLDASTTVAAGQSLTIGGKDFSMVNARDIRDNITYWNSMVRSLGGTGGRIPVYGGTPVDS